MPRRDRPKDSPYGKGRAPKTPFFLWGLIEAWEGEKLLAPVVKGELKGRPTSRQLALRAEAERKEGLDFLQFYLPDTWDGTVPDDDVIRKTYAKAKRLAKQFPHVYAMYRFSRDYLGDPREEPPELELLPESDERLLNLMAHFTLTGDIPTGEIEEFLELLSKAWRFDCTAAFNDIMAERKRLNLTGPDWRDLEEEDPNQKWKEERAEIKREYAKIREAEEAIRTENFPKMSPEKERQAEIDYLTRMEHDLKQALKNFQEIKRERESANDADFVQKMEEDIKETRRLLRSAKRKRKQLLDSA